MSYVWLSRGLLVMASPRQISKGWGFLSWPWKFCFIRCLCVIMCNMRVAVSGKQSEISSGDGHDQLLVTLHGLSEAQNTGQSLCYPLLKIITEKLAIKTFPAVSSSSSPWHSLYHFSSKWIVSTHKSTYSRLLSSLVNLYFSSCQFTQSKILLVQHGGHTGLSPVINSKLDWEDHCQFGVCVLSRLGRE